MTDAAQELDIIARKMFEDYNTDAGGKTWDGKPIPKWDSDDADVPTIGDAVRQHWRAAAVASIKHITDQYILVPKINLADLPMEGKFMQGLIERLTLVAYREFWGSGIDDLSVLEADTRERWTRAIAYAAGTIANNCIVTDQHQIVSRPAIMEELDK